MHLQAPARRIACRRDSARWAPSPDRSRSESRSPSILKPDSDRHPGKYRCSNHPVRISGTGEPAADSRHRRTPLPSLQREIVQTLLTRIRKQTRPQRIFTDLILVSSDAFDDGRRLTSTVDFPSGRFLAPISNAARVSSASSRRAADSRALPISAAASPRWSPPAASPHRRTRSRQSRGSVEAGDPAGNA